MRTEHETNVIVRGEMQYVTCEQKGVGGKVVFVPQDADESLLDLFDLEDTSDNRELAKKMFRERGGLMHYEDSDGWCMTIPVEVEA
jgi:hypothetical protein